MATQFDEALSPAASLLGTSPREKTGPEQVRTLMMESPSLKGLPETSRERVLRLAEEQLKAKGYDLEPPQPEVAEPEEPEEEESGRSLLQFDPMSPLRGQAQAAEGLALTALKPFIALGGATSTALGTGLEQENLGKPFIERVSTQDRAVGQYMWDVMKAESFSELPRDKSNEIVGHFFPGMTGWRKTGAEVATSLILDPLIVGPGLKVRTWQKALDESAQRIMTGQVGAARGMIENSMLQMMSYVPRTPATQQQFKYWKTLARKADALGNNQAGRQLVKEMSQVLPDTPVEQPKSVAQQWADDLIGAKKPVVEKVETPTPSTPTGAAPDGSVQIRPMGEDELTLYGPTPQHMEVRVKELREALSKRGDNLTVLEGEAAKSEANLLAGMKAIQEGDYTQADEVLNTLRSSVKNLRKMKKPAGAQSKEEFVQAQTHLHDSIAELEHATIVGRVGKEGSVATVDQQVAEMGKEVRKIVKEGVETPSPAASTPVVTYKSTKEARAAGIKFSPGHLRLRYKSIEGAEKGLLRNESLNAEEHRVIQIGDKFALAKKQVEQVTPPSTDPVPTPAAAATPGLEVSPAVDQFTGETVTPLRAATSALMDASDEASTAAGVRRLMDELSDSEWAGIFSTEVLAKLNDVPISLYRRAFDSAQSGRVREMEKAIKDIFDEAGVKGMEIKGPGKKAMEALTASPSILGNQRGMIEIPGLNKIFKDFNEVFKDKLKGTFLNDSLNTITHPATYPDRFIPLLASIAIKFKANTVLDVFGGVGTIGKIKNFGYKGKVIANELEGEWSALHKSNGVDISITGDARNLKGIKDNSIDLVATSPAYGNSMAELRLGNRDRLTYANALGRTLTEGNSGRMQYGKPYRNLHQEVYKELFRVVSDNGHVVINNKNFIKDGRVIDVTAFHRKAMEDAGFTLIDHQVVKSPGSPSGKISMPKVKSEDFLIFEKSSSVKKSSILGNQRGALEINPVMLRHAGVQTMGLTGGFELDAEDGIDIGPFSVGWSAEKYLSSGQARAAWGISGLVATRQVWKRGVGEKFWKKLEDHPKLFSLARSMHKTERLPKELWDFMQGLRKGPDLFLRRYARQLHSLTQDLTQDELKLISDIIEQEGPNWVNAARDPRLAEPAKEIVELLGKVRKSLVDAGMPEEVVSKYGDKYLHRVYSDKDTSFIGRAAKAMKISGRYLEARGPKPKPLKKAELEEMLQNVQNPQPGEKVYQFTDLNKNYIFHERDPRLARAKQALLRAHEFFLEDIPKKGLGLKRDYTRWERQAMGEERDVTVRLMDFLREASNDIILGKAFQSIANNPALAVNLKDRTAAHANWVYVPQNITAGGVKKYGAAAGKLVSPDVKYLLDGMTNRRFHAEWADSLYKHNKKYMGYWKLGKTAMQSSTHGVNTLSNFMLSFMDGHNPARVAWEGASEVYNQGRYFQETVDLGLLDGNILRAETDIKSYLDSLNTMKDKGFWTQAKDFITNPIKGAWRTGLRVYEFEDEMFKVGTYIAKRREGVEPERALKFANEMFFDYRDVPRGVAALRDYGWVPFITWSYKALHAIPRLVDRRPERVAAVMIGWGLWNDANYALMFENSAKEAELKERHLSPPWMRGRREKMFGIGPPMARRQLTDDPDAAKFAEWGRWVMPLSDITQTKAGQLAVGHPLATILVGSLTNKHLGFDRDIKPHESRDPDIDFSDMQKEENLRAWAEFVTQTLLPNMPYIPGSFSNKDLGRMLISEGVIDEELGQRVFGVTGKDNVGLPVSTGRYLSDLIGMKTREINIPLAGDKKIGAYASKYKEAERRFISLTLKQQQTGAVTDRDMEQAYNNLLKAEKLLSERIIKHREVMEEGSPPRRD